MKLQLLLNIQTQSDNFASGSEGEQRYTPDKLIIININRCMVIIQEDIYRVKARLDHVICEGHEESLFACTHRGIGNHRSYNKRAGVKCRCTAQCL